MLFIMQNISSLNQLLAVYFYYFYLLLYLMSLFFLNFIGQRF
jgi:hypothetical protein